MKIGEREKLMMTFVAIVVILVFFFMFLLPPALDNLKALEDREMFLLNEITEVRNNMDKGSIINNEYKTLNIKTLAFSNKYYPELAQERIVLDLNNLLTESGLEGNNISFAEGQQKQLKINTGEIGTNKMSFNNLPSLKVSISYGSGFDKFLSFLQKIGDFEKKILINKIDIVNAGQKRGTTDLVGNIILDFYEVPSYLQTSTEFSVGEFGGEFGGMDPFSGISLVDANLIDFLIGKEKRETCDFVLTVKPITSDLPTVVFGFDADISADSFVCADSVGVENAELHLFMEDDQYLCNYSAGGEIYPSNMAGANISSVIAGQNLLMKIFSNPRTSIEDQSGVSLSIINETDKTLVVNLINDDPERPRVNIAELSGSVEIR